MSQAAHRSTETISTKIQELNLQMSCVCCFRWRTVKINNIWVCPYCYKDSTYIYPLKTPRTWICQDNPCPESLKMATEKLEQFN